MDSYEPRRKTLISTEGWTFDGIVRQSPRFEPVKRVPIPTTTDDHIGIAQLTDALDHHEKSGEPLVLEGLHKHPAWSELFSLDWLLSNFGSLNAKARNIHDWTDQELTLSDFIEKSRAMPRYTQPGETERLYGKDAECPEAWQTWMTESGVIPSSLLPHSPEDFMAALPKEAQVETLMSYIGIGDTFTPAHKDLCGSSGQNFMAWSDPSSGNEGSSFWLMTKGPDAPRVEEFFHSLNEELDLETHVVTLKELAKGDFTTYIVEQKLGDMVLVPPRSAHQVVNNGGITIKVSWSRMTTRGLQTAVYHELPIYRRVCRQETYRVKSMVQHAIAKRTADLERFVGPNDEAEKARVVDDLCTLLPVFDDILRDEYEPTTKSMVRPHSSAHITCDFCAADIYQSWYECRSCTGPDDTVERDEQGHCPPGDGVVICPSCYVEGRTCKCETMQPMQMGDFLKLETIRKNACIGLISGLGSDSLPFLNNGYLIGFLKAEIPASLFRSGCILYRQRQARPEKSRAVTCSVSTCAWHPRHIVPDHAMVRCSTGKQGQTGCNHASCYSKILHHSNIHAADIFNFQTLAKDPSEWHSYHMRGKGLFEMAKEALHEAGVDGTRPNPKFKLVDLALKFENSRPVNHTLVKGGFYDEQTPILKMHLEPTVHAEVLNIKDDSSTEGHTSESRFTPVEPLATSSISDVQDTEAGPVPGKRKHKYVLDGVFVGTCESFNLQRYRGVVKIGPPRRAPSVVSTGEASVEDAMDIEEGHSASSPNERPKQADAERALAARAIRPSRKRLQPMLMDESESDDDSPRSVTKKRRDSDEEWSGKPARVAVGLVKKQRKSSPDNRDPQAESIVEKRVLSRIPKLPLAERARTKLEEREEACRVREKNVVKEEEALRLRVREQAIEKRQKELNEKEKELNLRHEALLAWDRRQRDERDAGLAQHFKNNPALIPMVHAPSPTSVVDSGPSPVRRSVSQTTDGNDTSERPDFPTPQNPSTWTARGGGSPMLQRSTWPPEGSSRPLNRTNSRSRSPVRFQRSERGGSSYRPRSPPRYDSRDRRQREACTRYNRSYSQSNEYPYYPRLDHREPPRRPSSPNWRDPSRETFVSWPSDVRVAEAPSERPISEPSSTGERQERNREQNRDPEHRSGSSNDPTDYSQIDPALARP